jgi:hypothetical protein
VLLVNLNVPGTDYKSTIAEIAKEPKKYFFALSSGGSAGPRRDARIPAPHQAAARHRALQGHGARPTPTCWRAACSSSWIRGRRCCRSPGPARRGPVRDLEGAHRCAPDIPTTDEVGLTGFNISSWYGVWAPKATPDPIVDRLAVAMAEVSKDKGFIAKTGALASSDGARPGRLRGVHQDRSRDQHKLLQDAGYKPE